MTSYSNIKGLILALQNKNTISNTQTPNGITLSISANDVDIKDKNIILNKGGNINSAGDSGISIEENNNITGYIKVDPSRNNFNIKAPSNNFILNTPIIAQNEIVSTENFVRQWLPIGAIIMWSGNTAPTGWALCDGNIYVRSDGSGNITTPDLRGRFILALGQGPLNIANATVGATGGEQNHTLTINEMPSHSHTGTSDSKTTGITIDSSGAHTHEMPMCKDDGNSSNTIGQYPAGDAELGSNQQNVPTLSAGSHSHTITDPGHTHTFTTNSTGGGQAHNNMPPYYVLAYIIKI